MAILFAGSSAADLGGNTSHSTLAGTFDPAYSDSSAQVVTIFNAGESGFTLNFDKPAGDMWLHFLVKTPVQDFASTGVDGFWLTIYDGLDAVASLDLVDGVAIPTVFGDTQEIGEGVANQNNALVPIDIRVSVGANIVLDLYYNGTLIGTATAANTGGKAAPDRVTFRHYDFVNSTNTNTLRVWYSEVIVTDGEPTIGWRLATLKPNTAGTHAQWTGGATELGDEDTATMASTDTAGQRVSWNPTAYNGAASPTGIRGVLSVANGGRGAASPQQIAHFVRIGGVDYDAAAQPMDGTGPVLTEWATNPATGSPWTVSDLAAFEGGLKSEA